MDSLHSHSLGWNVPYPLVLARPHSMFIDSLCLPMPTWAGKITNFFFLDFMINIQSSVFCGSLWRKCDVLLFLIFWFVCIVGSTMDLCFCLDSERTISGFLPLILYMFFVLVPFTSFVSIRTSKKVILQVLLFNYDLSLHAPRSCVCWTLRCSSSF